VHLKAHDFTTIYIEYQIQLIMPNAA